ncbi:MAG: 2-C-methyl-D-erythritol 2,4-cyclodiphosphate synthase [Clostridiales bacterium]|jgi:2-C-methyl-D-erythritol 2,4-cyclodiphosphate synthase|nr:2-C-methyl-D-erythritol 2,4-cyclodiphosphate synthase [Clostridiales bacterium]
MKIGFGFDVHKFKMGRKLILGGVDIACEYGLLGHSDADVLVHSIIDSMFGALGLGDIGKHFPDSDEKYKDVSSLELLKITYEMMRSRRYKISNIDSSLVIEKPKIQYYVDKMVRNISEILKVSENIVNIKATTTENLGFVGRGEGASAYSVILIEEN